MRRAWVVAVLVVLAGLAVWLVGRADGTAHSHGERRDSATGSPGTATGSDSTDPERRSDTSDDPDAEDRGVITGRIAPPVPGGVASVVLRRDGVAVHNASLKPGPFSVDFERKLEGAFSAVFMASGAVPVELELPTPTTHCGEIRLASGIVYPGRVVDKSGQPLAGVSVWARSPKASPCGSSGSTVPHSWTPSKGARF